MSGAGTTVGAMSEWWGRVPGVGDLVRHRGSGSPCRRRTAVTGMNCGRPILLEDTH